MGTPLIKSGPRINLLVAVPCMDNVPSGFLYDYGQMMAAIGIYSTENPHSIAEFGTSFETNTLIQVARQTLALQAIKEDYTHILWLDSDMRFPADLPLRLLARNQDLVGINYSSRKIPPKFVAKNIEFDGKKVKATRVPTTEESTGLEAVDIMGFGGVMMRVSLLHRLFEVHDPMGENGPWFQVRYDPRRRANVGEDAYFCELVRETLGAEVFIDHDLSKECAHIGAFEYTLDHAAAMGRRRLMARITSYQTLQDEVVRELNRSDLVTDVPRFIQSAEDTLRREPRVRRLRVTEDFIVSEATHTVPDNFRSLDSLSFSGVGGFTGELQVVSVGDISGNLATFGPLGLPKVVCYDGEKLRFAPVPDAAYTMLLSWWETVPRLGGSVLTNWLLEEHSDIYLYSTLLESAPFLRDDARIQTWVGLMESRIEGLHKSIPDTLYSGPISRPPVIIF